MDLLAHRCRRPHRVGIQLAHLCWVMQDFTKLGSMDDPQVPYLERGFDSSLVSIDVICFLGFALHGVCP